MTSRITTLLLLLSACADPIGGIGTPQPDVPAVPDSGAAIPATSGNFTHESTGMSVETNVDAADTEAWQYLDMDTGVSTDDPAEWDLAFRRFFIRLNGGITGNAGVLVHVSETEYASLTQAPDSGWTSAVPDGAADDDDEADTPFNNGEDDWYDYDVTTHTLAAKTRAYAIRSSLGRYYRFQLEDYYDQAGSPAQISFRWSLIDGPSAGDPDAGVTLDASMPDAGPRADSGPPPGSTLVDASDAMNWTYYSATNGVVTPDAPEASDEWDIAFRRSEVRTNSGVSGVGAGGAKATEAAFDSIVVTDTFDFAVDALIDTGAPGSTPTSLNPILRSWYDYDPRIHAVTPKDLRYIVRGGDGAYYKLEISGWSSGVYTIRMEPIEFEASIRELEFVSADAEAWVDLDLTQTYVDAEAEVVEGRWDLSASRTLWRSNGGESAGGMAAAALIDVELDALGDPSGADAFVEDTTIEPSRPGQEAFVGNTVLGDWFDYDPATRIVTPKPIVFLVRTRSGDLAAMQITGWDDGTYALRIRYAGPRQEVFQ